MLSRLSFVGLRALRGKDSYKLSHHPGREISAPRPAPAVAARARVSR